MRQGRKWTKEYTRERVRPYTGERWRRVHGAKPENCQVHTRPQEAEQLVRSKFGEGAVEYAREEKKKDAEKRAKRKEEKPPVPVVVCPVCLVEHKGTEGTTRKHERTTKHRLGVELYEAHKKALTEGPR